MLEMNYLVGYIKTRFGGPSLCRMQKGGSRWFVNCAKAETMSTPESDGIHHLSLNHACVFPLMSCHMEIVHFLTVHCLLYSRIIP